MGQRSVTGRKTKVALMLLLALTLTTACGAKKQMDSASGGAPGSAADMAVKPGAYEQSRMGSDSSANQGAPPSGKELEAKLADNAATGVASIDRKLILNAQIDVKVNEGDSAVQRITDAVKAAGGYVQESRQDGTKEQGRRLFLTLRVPSSQHDSILALAESVGEVQSRRAWTNDVTEEYLDVEARIKTKEAHLTQLQKLYERTGSITEMISLEQEIARITAELESLKGRFQYLSNQVSFSTITFTLYEPGAPTPIQPPKNVWDRMKRGFIDSWNGLVNFFGNTAVGIVSLVPLLLVLVPAGYAGYRFYRRWAQKRQSPPAA